ncbi:MAG: DUF423 domain-containing protein [Planctomycetes bacterium]|nr:DUF423 domain-containing protein [Planctomycetota bacterium]
MNGRWFLVAAAILAASGVALGAYAAHGLADRLESLGYVEDASQRIAWFETGVRYQLYHALGLILVTLLAANGFGTFRFASLAFLAGVVLFSGSLYAMSFAPDQWKKLGAIVPLGGLSFILGWIAIAYAAWNTSENQN